jgi:type II secretory pathway predicted ATPase ExeA
MPGKPMQAAAAFAAEPGGAPSFVGREREIEAIAAALADGLHVVVAGRYGMGRTALLRRVAARLMPGSRCAFASFELTPAGICGQLLADLAGQAGLGGPPRRRPERRRSHLAVRAALLRAPLADPRPHVLVLDDLGRLSPPKLDLVRRFSACGRFRLAAIVEPFLAAPQRLRLDAWLEPACRVTLGPLEPAAARLFFARLAAAHRLPWSAAAIDGLARASCGHPRRMRELANRELARAARAAATAAAPAAPVDAPR